MSEPALASFREMYDANVAFVWRALRRLGVAEADTPDAVQEVFLVAHRRMADFEGRSKASTWLFGSQNSILPTLSRLRRLRSVRAR